jgi:signal transduction histidine kinase
MPTGATPTDDGAADDPRPPRTDRLLEAVLAVGSELSLDAVLERIVTVAVDLVDARYGALGVLDEEGSALERFIHVGMDEAVAAQLPHPPQGHGILGLLIVDPEPLRLDDLTRHPESAGWPAPHPPMRSFLGVPITVRGRAYGNLYLTEKAGGEPFTLADEELVVALAAAAATAIDNARLHARLAELSVVEDRERIARQLHDTVIQRIFATALSLQGIAARVDDPELSDRLAGAVDDLDQTVRHIRTTIFELQRPRLPGRSLRRDLLEVAAEAGRPHGRSIATSFDGPVDSLVDERTGEQLLAVAQEALANAIRHADAGRIELDVRVGEGCLVLQVADDGRGPGSDPAACGGRGLANLASRAADLGGTSSLTARPEGGAVLTWSVPLPDGRHDRPR